MLGSISALVVMQLGRRLAPAWPRGMLGCFVDVQWWGRYE